MTTNMTATPAMTPLVTREELLTTGEAFERSCNALAKRYTPEQLIEQIGDHYGKARGHFAKGLNQLIEVGKRLESLKRHGEYGTYMERIEAMEGIGRTSAQHYRDLARFAANLRAEPNFATLSLNGAKELIASWKAALKDDNDLDAPIAPKGGKPKAPGAPRQRRTLERMFSRLVEFARENRYEPDLDEQLDHGIARIQHVRAQLKNPVVDAEPEDQGE
ncbi:MAG: hypothetical protein FWD12_08665 [Alphaproteobacteria bacterium]|nr:hypothetical protein [Alphaproteobacteria bacterium]